MSRRGHQEGLPGRPAQPPHRTLPAVRRAMVHDPDDPRRRRLRRWPPHWRHPAAAGAKSRPRFAATEEGAPSDVPGRQVWPRPAPLIRVRDAQRPTATGPPRRRAAPTCWDPRLLVGAAEVIRTAPGRAWPDARVQVPEDRGLGGNRRVAGEDPVLLTPGLKRRLVHEAPDRPAADELAPFLPGAAGPVAPRLAAERRTGPVDARASPGPDEGLVRRGKTGACVPARIGLPGSSPRRPPVSARGGRGREGVGRRRRRGRARAGGSGRATRPAGRVGGGRRAWFGAGEGRGRERRTPEESSAEALVGAPPGRPSRAAKPGSALTDPMNLANPKPGNYF